MYWFRKSTAVRCAVIFGVSTFCRLASAEPNLPEAPGFASFPIDKVLGESSVRAKIGMAKEVYTRISTEHSKPTEQDAELLLILLDYDYTWRGESIRDIFDRMPAHSKEFLDSYYDYYVRSFCREAMLRRFSSDDDLPPGRYEYALYKRWGGTNAQTSCSRSSCCNPALSFGPDELPDLHDEVVRQINLAISPGAGDGQVNSALAHLRMIEIEKGGDFISENQLDTLSRFFAVKYKNVYINLIEVFWASNVRSKKYLDMIYRYYIDYTCMGMRNPNDLVWGREQGESIAYGGKDVYANYKDMGGDFKEMDMSGKTRQIDIEKNCK